MSERVILDGVDLAETGRAFRLTMDGLAQMQAEQKAREVEWRILSGENHFQVDNVIYKVPGWLEAPVRRVKIERARFRHRRKNPS